jgi:hypothetical protein
MKRAALDDEINKNKVSVILQSFTENQLCSEQRETKNISKGDEKH